MRTTAFRILTAFPGEGPDLADEMHRAWASDPNGQARFHAALFLSKCAYGDTFGALARIARQDGTNRWTRAAVISGLKGRENYFFETVMRQTNSALPPELMRDLCRLDVNPSEAVLALTDPDAAERLFGVRQIKGEGAASWQLAGLAGLCETLRAPPGSSHAAPKLADFVDRVFGEPAIWKTDGRFLASLLARAEFLLADEAQPLVVRESALKVLLHERGAAIAPALLQRFRPNEDPAVQQAAARALVNLPEENFVRDLLAPDRWNVLSPNVRATLLGLLLSQPRHTETLLELMEQGRVLSSQIGRAQRDRLLNHKNGTIQARARKLFTEVGGDRMKAYQGQKAVLQLTGDASHGREVFQTHCATCHRLSGQGYSVGPDIFGMRSQSKETILLHVIVPNYEINPGFVAYEIQTADDRSLTGLIASETATSLTIRQAQGLEETLRRSEIRSIQASAVSLMPEELEKTMSQRDLADLLAFLKGE
ncbi:MAG: c-type cytochrome [Verrucomicrobiota bacterium]